MHLAYSHLTRRREEEDQEDEEVEWLEDEARAVWEEAHEKATIVRVIFCSRTHIYTPIHTLKFKLILNEVTCRFSVLIQSQSTCCVTRWYW